MARQGTQQNNEANTQYTQAQTTALNNAAQDRANYNAAVSKLEAEGNPFTRADYLQNENLAAATGADAANASAEEGVKNAVGRTGTNAAALPYYKLAAGKMRARAAADTLVNQRAQDAQQAAAWNQWLANAKLGAGSMDTSLYGTSTSGRSDALNNLTQLGLASYQPFNSIMSAAGAAGGAAITKCWVAMALWGPLSPKTKAVRAYLGRWSDESCLGAIVVGLYARFGKRMSRVGWMRNALRPLFEFAAVKAMGR